MNTRITMDPWATHQQVLLAACHQTTGPIVELGCGLHSTQLLHDTFPGRLIFSVDHDKNWLNMFTYLACDTHTFTLVKDYYDYKVPVEKAGVLFIDCWSAAGRRRKVLENNADKADLIVIHDTEPACGERFNWGDCFTKFKYHYQELMDVTWKGKNYQRGTTVVSNFQSFTKP